MPIPNPDEPLTPKKDGLLHTMATLPHNTSQVLALAQAPRYPTWGKGYTAPRGAETRSCPMYSMLGEDVVLLFEVGHNA